jgi:hypothetical protein
MINEDDENQMALISSCMHEINGNTYIDLRASCLT